MDKIKSFFKDEEGASAVEYALLVSLIAMAILIGAATLGTNINDKLNEVAGKIKGG